MLFIFDFGYGPRLYGFVYLRLLPDRGRGVALCGLLACVLWATCLLGPYALCWLLPMFCWLRDYRCQLASCLHLALAMSNNSLFTLPLWPLCPCCIYSLAATPMAYCLLCGMSTSPTFVFYVTLSLSLSC